MNSARNQRATGDVIFRAVLPRLLALIAAVLMSTRATAQNVDAWHLVLIGDERTGWMHYREEDLGYGLKTSNTIRIEIARGETPVTIRIASEFVESYDGKPFEMTLEQELGAEPIKQMFRWQDDGSVKVTVTRGEESTIQTLPAVRGEWLTPAAARGVLRRYLDDRAPRFDYVILDFMAGLTTTRVTSHVVGRTIIDAVGKRIPVVSLRTEQSASPGIVTTEHVDADGVPVRSELNLGGIALVVTRSEKELALAPFEPTELLVNTFVIPTRAIHDPRNLRSATYVLSLPDGVMPDLPDTGVQRVARLDERSIHVSVDLGRVAPAIEEELRNGAYYIGSQMINWRDPAIVEIADRAIARQKTLPNHEKAERARRFVHRYVQTKSLDVGLASASETCRTQEGDCTEHAVLLAAMLRYYGIPSRVASGLIYAEEFAGRARIFGYHMWTQALVEDAEGVLRWVDLDATLPTNTPFDATHIALSISPMNDGDVINSMATLAPLLGRLEIEVESTAHDPAPEPVSR